MLKTILVPLDSSPRAEAVLPIAARLAHNTNGTLVLVRVVSFATDYWPAIATPYPSTMQTAVDEEMKEATTYLEKVASFRRKNIHFKLTFVHDTRMMKRWLGNAIRSPTISSSS